MVSLAFLTPSLRTRAGFAHAVARLGGAAIETTEHRQTAGMSAGEDPAHIVRVLRGWSDLVVVRGAIPIDAAVDLGGVAPVLNAGDGGAGSEHPSQALIDLAAIRREAGSEREVHVGICGDLDSRCTRSLLALFARFPPARLSLIAPPGRDDPGVAVPADVERRPAGAVGDVDVLYLVGLPEGTGAAALGAVERRRYAFDDDARATLPDAAVVLAPGPVIDEIGPTAWDDPRVRVFEQSDHAVAVRAALVELLTR